MTSLNNSPILWFDRLESSDVCVDKKTKEIILDPNGNPKSDILTHNAKSLIKYLKEHGPNNDFYEFVSKETYIKPYFDLDCKIDDKNTNICLENKEQILKNALDFIRKEFNINNDIIDNECFAICDGSRSDKISFHINIIGKKTKINDLIQWKNDNTQNIKKYHIDPGVYRQGCSKMRMIYCRGKKTEQQLLPINNKNIYHTHFIGVVDDNYDIWTYYSKISKNIPPNTNSTPDTNLNNKITGYVCNTTNPKHIHELLTLLNPTRYDNYFEWINCGMALRNSDHQNDGLFNIWNDWSKSSSKYNEDICRQKWDSFSKRNPENGNALSIGSIHEWAKQDQPEQYNKFKELKCLANFINNNIKNNTNKNDICVSNVNKDAMICTANVGDEHCLVSDVQHDQPLNYFHMQKKPQHAWVTCKHADCISKLFNNATFPVDDKTIKVIFGDGNNININIYNGSNNNNTNTINNYGTSESDNLYICDDYPIFDDKELNNYIMESLNNTPYDIAKVLWYLTKDKFKCTCSETKTWFCFKEHRWTKTSVDIKEFISNDLTKYYRTVYKYYLNLAKNETNDNDRKLLDCKTKRILELMNSLKKTNAKNNILIEASVIFYSHDTNFYNKLDQQINLIGFNNGVYDLEKLEFRDGKSDDYVTMSVGYDYEDSHTEYFDELKQFLYSIQPDEIERNYMLTSLSLALFGENSQEIISILTGCGRNGKSKVMNLMEKTLGEYYENISASLLTNEQPSADKPRPELLTIMKKRFIVASEPEADRKINSSFVKLLTGNDNISARGLYKNDVITFIPQFNIYLLCNDIPQFDKNDDAIWDRCRCIEFPMKFVKNPIGDNQSQIDYNIKNKLKKWGLDMILLLIQHYKEFLVTGLNPTKKVLRFTKQTREENDIYKVFLEEKTEQSKTHIHTSVLYDAFKTWFVVNNPKSKQIPSNRVFCKEMRRYHIIDKNVRYNGIPTTGIKILKLNLTQNLFAVTNDLFIP